MSSLSGDDDSAEALIAGWPWEERPSELGLTRADSEPFWGVYEPTRDHLGIRYAWERQYGAVRMTFERGGAG